MQFDTLTANLKTAQADRAKGVGLGRLGEKGPATAGRFIAKVVVGKGADVR